MLVVLNEKCWWNCKVGEKIKNAIFENVKCKEKEDGKGLFKNKQDETVCLKGVWLICISILCDVTRHICKLKGQGSVCKWVEPKNAN